MRKSLLTVAGLVALSMTGGASAQTRRAPAPDVHSLDQAYAIVDFQTALSGREIAQALQRHIANANVTVTARNQTVAAIPRAPGRFTLIDPAAPGGFGLEGPASRAPAGWLRPVRAAVCDGASWRADVAPRRPGRVEQRYTLCLFPYRDGRRQGHQLDIYAVTLLHGDPGAVAPRASGETPAAFMRGAVRAVERLTRVQGVWVENRLANADRPFTRDDDAWAAQTN
ncbi:hypothetical protein SH203_01464 [Brevundimonas sp. SH203]|uniref:hypothetical protein n=1 Tax=Brevundimonas sp. SH203 TaxID=345167 RepID=UPI0009D044A8|nr:hypothetical protein [Brevundimonas sp. SH203]GAW41061.1 hypothetical protein SH203_01464 [Brevundimonas sp. SH203]